MNTTAGDSLTILILESYAPGSHGRVIDLLKRYSAHSIHDMRLDREHWKWLALAGHYSMADMVNRIQGSLQPDLLVFSGPLNIAALIPMLPQRFQKLPRVAYFHESQWTYPAQGEDRTPYQMQHLDAVALCTEAWFNSRFHREDFWTAAISGSPRMQRVASKLEDSTRSTSTVLYPPVLIDEPIDYMPQQAPPKRITWNARWEHDKRPDLFLELLNMLGTSTVQPSVRVLGTAGKPVAEIVSVLGRHAHSSEVPGHLASRQAYEAALSGPGLVVSTAEHEFFGIAMLETVLAGNIPVLPRSLAYPETLPSAWFYEPGDIADLARTVEAAFAAAHHVSPLFLSDAQRFTPDRIVPVWDENFARVVRDF